MSERLSQFFKSLKAFVGKLTPRQRVLLGAVLFLSFASLLAMMIWAGRPDFTVLFSNLDPKDAGAIVERLKESKIPFQLKNDGTTILVPSAKVYELRLEMASQGLPQTGGVGYEIFDKNTIGVTDFVQKLNYRRALEGELARTIRGFAEIENARVHIVIPEPSLFTEREKAATASIALKLARGAKLTANQIQGIANLVAFSVEGLKPENITIVDSYGRALSDQLKKDSLAGLSSTQLELQTKVEQYLADKAQSLLDGVVGPHNAIVRVTAELDFDQVERTVEKYDPENTVIRSEETDTEISNSSDNKPGRSESTITNYEISKTIEHVVETVGNIKRLSVAVLLNGTYGAVVGEKGKTERQPVPRSPEEITRLTNIVRSAVGFDATRGDQVEVTEIPFDTSVADEEREYMLKQERREFWFSVLQKAAVAGAVVLAVLILRSIGKALRTSAGRPSMRFPVETMGLEEQPTPRLQERLQKQQLVAQLSREKPNEMAKLLRAWLLEEKTR